MKFGEKLREARLKKGLSQAKLAEMTGVAKRTLINYENNGILPKQKDTYFILAKALEIDANVLMDDNAEFVTQATEVYGSRGAKQALHLVQEITGLYAGGELEEEDMDAMMKAIQDAYWIAKQKNRRHVNKRFLSEEE